MPTIKEQCEAIWNGAMINSHAIVVWDIDQHRNIIRRVVRRRRKK